MRAEEEAAKSTKSVLVNAAYIHSILNTIEDNVWLIDSDFRLVDFNQAFFYSFKTAFNVELKKGHSILELLPENLLQLRVMWRTRYMECLKGKALKYFDNYWIERELLTYEVKVFPVVEDGKVVGLSVFSRDITLQKKTENLLNDKDQELLKINSELDRFVYSASHNLRSPLMSVKGLINMIKIEQDVTCLRRYVGLIENSVDKMDHFISEIIQYSRNSRMDVISEEIDFYDIINQSIQTSRYIDGAECVRIISNITNPFALYSDSNRLSIIFNNVISNAISYRNKWKDSLLQIDVTIDQSAARINFMDNGIGIEERFQSEIFKMFFRATAESKGAGLGLYIVKDTVKKLDGKISLKSEFGTGTNLSIEIPNKAIIVS